MHPEDVGGYQSALEAHNAGRRSRIEAEFRLRRKDGGWVWIKTIGKAIERNASGNRPD